MFRIVRFFYGSGSTDPYPDFTDSDPNLDPDPTHLLVIFNKNNFLNNMLLIKSSHKAYKCYWWPKGKNIRT